MKKNILSRRDFVKNTGILTGSLMAAPLFSRQNFFPAGNEEIKVAVIGCGGRGTGAAAQALSVKQNTKLVAMADAFKDNLDECYKKLTGSDAKNLADSVGLDIRTRVQVPEENKFHSFDAYKKAIALADVVILTTPPGFRPIHFEEAIKQGKHVFMEKPVATDPAGIKKVLEMAEVAKSKKLNVVVGLQRHYQKVYRELMKRVYDGKIGDIVSGQVYWNNDGVWVRPRKEGQTEMEYQMRNWYYFNWLCGDHINEQHIHNIDVMNWAKNAYPVRAQGMGGRTTRVGKEYGEIFDHHFVEFEYADGSILNSQCRHQKGTMSRVDEMLVGTKGSVKFGAGLMKGTNGKVIYKHEGKGDPNPYQVEHDELFEAIAKGEYRFADAENGAKSTMTSILGRMATYSGQVIEWDKAINSGISLQPAAYDWQTNPPILPDANGMYPAAIPGKTKFFT
ncbi:MAG: Gfo/Idh/MocA family oxidoreductase [Saprospiraceae bacterium]|nr:Gfo/Idh/MocA family oxidoreductase [Saprospiraceae bacterium]